MDDDKADRGQDRMNKKERGLLPFSFTLQAIYP